MSCLLMHLCECVSYSEPPCGLREIKSGPSGGAVSARNLSAISPAPFSFSLRSDLSLFLLGTALLSSSTVVLKRLTVLL